MVRAAARPRRSRTRRSRRGHPAVRRRRDPSEPGPRDRPRSSRHPARRCLDASIDHRPGPGASKRVGGARARGSAARALDGHGPAVRPRPRPAAKGSGHEPTTAGTLHRAGPVAVVPPDPVTAVDANVGGAHRGLDSVHVEEPVLAPSAALGAGQAVDRLHEAAAVAGRDVGRPVEQADHGVRLRRVGVGRADHHAAAVVAGHGEASRCPSRTGRVRSRSRRPGRPVRAPPRSPGRGPASLPDHLLAARGDLVVVVAALDDHLVAASPAAHLIAATRA